MKILWNAKDGGPESRVWCWGIESKRFGSILLMRFARGSREAFHTHAFHAISWVLKGGLMEAIRGAKRFNFYFPSLKPVITRRETFHQVVGLDANNYVFSLRGPWVDRWREHLPDTKRDITLTHGRKEIA